MAQRFDPVIEAIVSVLPFGPSLSRSSLQIEHFKHNLYTSSNNTAAEK